MGIQCLWAVAFDLEPRLPVEPGLRIWALEAAFALFQVKRPVLQG